MNKLLKKMVADAKRYCKRHGIAMSTLAGKAAGDGKLFVRIEQGRSIEMDTYTKIIDFIALDGKIKEAVGNVDKSGRLGAVLGVDTKRKARSRRASPPGGRPGTREAEPEGID